MSLLCSAQVCNTEDWQLNDVNNSTFLFVLLSALCKGTCLFSMGEALFFHSFFLCIGSIQKLASLQNSCVQT